MRPVISLSRWTAWTALAMSTLMVIGPEAVAAEGAGEWRETYDVIMMWINFGLLVFVIVKFARNPIRNFFQARQLEVSRQVDRLEADKAQSEAQIQQTRQLMEDSRLRFEEIRKRIVNQGQKQRDHIIAEAKEHGRVMVEDARRKAENRIRQARHTLREEMIDTAVQLAARRLPREITAEDQQNFLNLYLEGATSE